MKLNRTFSVKTAALVAGALLSAPANAAITFTYDYSQGVAGTGFLDPTLGASRQQALSTAGDLFSNLFAQYFTNSGNIVIQAVGQNSGVASAGSFDVGTPGFGTGEVVRNKLTTGIDLNGGAADAVVNVNFGLNF